MHQLAPPVSTLLNRLHNPSLSCCSYDGLYCIIRAGMEPSQAGPLVCRWAASETEMAHVARAVPLGG